MKAKECVRILDCLKKSPYLVKWIGLDDFNASVTMKVGDLETEIIVGVAVGEKAPIAQVFFSNGTVSAVELTNEASADYLYQKCVELHKIVKEYSEAVLSNSCCPDNIDRTDNYPIE